MEYLRKLHVHLWAEKHRVSIAMRMFAQQAALYCEHLYWLMQRLRTSEVQSRLPARPNPKEWLLLYCRHGRIWRVLSDLPGAPPGLFGSNPKELAGGLRAMEFWRKNNPEEFKRSLAEIGDKRLRRLLQDGWKSARKSYHAHLREIRKDLSEISDGADDARRLGEWLTNKPEVHFFLAVMLPCFVHYEAMPWVLLRKAREGDDDAIEKLLRLDATLMSDPRIASWVNDGSGTVRTGRVEMASSWMKDGIKGQFALPMIKQSVAGLISVLSEGLNLRITPPATVERRRLTAAQLWELFSAVAKDRGLSGDKYLLELDNMLSWQKAIQRHANIWRETLRLRVDKDSHK